MNTTTKSNQLILALMVSFFSLMLACKSKEEVVIIPNQPPGNFNVTSTLGSNGQDVILKWTKSEDPEGDAVTYSVVYTDTLAKNLSDTTFIIKKLPFGIEVKGSVVAKDTKGDKTVSNFSIKTGSDYVTIPDVNFEKALIELNIDDVQDGKILRANILKITTLEIDGQTKLPNFKIANINGIEAFINLKRLYIVYSNLKTVDVSKNTLLESIGFFGNELIRLDISKNILLTELYCDRNQLIDLDVSQNPALLQLTVTGNQLTNLDVSKNINLTTLECYGNQLSTLDISKNLTLSRLFCHSNNLKSLDITKNISLKELVCGYNPMSSLDLNQNRNLIFLFCTDSQLNSLDVSKIVGLKTLDCSNNKIQTICVSNLNQVKSDWQKDPTTTYKVCP
jgi:hypothetical protein